MTVMTVMTRGVTTTLLLLAGSAIASGDFYTDQYHTVQKVELYEVSMDNDGNEVESLRQEQKVPNALETMMTMPTGAKGSQALGEIIMTTNELIALGQKVYKIIEAGEPVLNVESKPISVLPKTLKGEPVEPMALSGWSAPKAKKYRVVAKNYLGMRPVTFEFILIFSYGGKYDGKGFYLTGAQLRPTDVQVGWAYKLDASFSVQSIVNQGSDSDPVAGAVLSIDYSIQTVLKKIKQSRQFFVNGLGHTAAY